MHFIFNLRHKNKLQKLGCFIDNMTFKNTVYIGKTVMYLFFSHGFLLANEECICLSLMFEFDVLPVHSLPHLSQDTSQINHAC